MNVYEAISDYLTNSMYNVDGYDSRVELAKLVAAYDALAPDWTKFSDDVQWYTIDCDGNVMVSNVEPEIEHTEWLVDIDCISREAGIVHLPIGIDWRLCKWQRPEVK